MIWTLDPPEFRTPEAFKTWLKDKPHEWGSLLATRAIMHVLPIISKAADIHDNKQQTLFLRLTSTCFRAAAIGRAAGIDPTRFYAPAERRRADAASRAVQDIARAVYSSLSYGNSYDVESAAEAIVLATRAVAEIDDNLAVLAIEAAAHTRARDAVWGALSQDAFFLEKRGHFTALAVEPIWISSWTAGAWTSLRSALPQNENWEVWIDWYEARLKKSRWSKKKEMIYASVPSEICNRGHRAINAWIYQELQKLKFKHGRHEIEEDDDRKLIEQSPAPTSFRILGEKIDAASETAGSIDGTVAVAFYDEVKRKSRELRERLERAQADKRLQSNLALLEARLGASLADISVGHLLPSLYSLERDFAVYNSEEGRKEHSLELIAALGDAAGSVRDFVALFPKVRQIEAEALALRIVQQPDIQEEIAEQGRKAIAAASDSPHVTSAAESALKDTEKSVATARDADERARQLSYLVLDLANFARAGIVLAAKEVGGFTGDCWREIRSRVPSRIGKLAALGVTLYGLSTLAENLPLEKIKLLRDLGGVVERLGKLIEDRPPPKASDKASTSEPSASAPSPKPNSRATDNNPPPHAEERPKGASRSARGSSRRRK